MRVAFITRSTIYTVRGGDTFQILETASHLEQLGVEVDIRLTHEKIDYGRYDLLHFFNIIRPADILYHIRRSGRPFVVSTLLIDYSAYDKYQRKGLAGYLFRFFSSDRIEYLKTMARFLSGRDKLMSKAYVWKGHQASVKEILDKAAFVFPGSRMEYSQLLKRYGPTGHDVLPIPNGLNSALFSYDDFAGKDELLVLCVARIEGIKNQLNLIRALNNTRYTLLIIGDPAPGHLGYYRECRKIAAGNIRFISQLPQQELVRYYQRAKVHILPSWWETCGLSSLEAGAMGCNIVITDKGYTREYYRDFAFYCNPDKPASILHAVDRAASTARQPGLRLRILNHYTWDRAAHRIARAYDKILEAV